MFKFFRWVARVDPLIVLPHVVWLNVGALIGAAYMFVSDGGTPALYAVTLSVWSAYVVGKRLTLSFEERTWGIVILACYASIPVVFNLCSMILLAAGMEEVGARIHEWRWAPLFIIPVGLITIAGAGARYSLETNLGYSEASADPS
jgi:hypothetical protein